MTTELAPAPGATFTCSSCGESFTEKEAAVACDNCVTRGGCGMLRCPRCGFEQTRTPAFLGRLLNLFRRRKAPRSLEEAVAGACAGSVPLSTLRAGESAVIEKFEQVSNVRKFLSLGILPGTHVTVIRHSPAMVLRVGYSEFAFDHALASTVQVHRLTLNL